MPSTAIDDPHKIVKVIASDGRSGDQKEVAYTNCKVIGNGSFGIVFQAKLELRKVMTSPSRTSFRTNASRCTHIHALTAWRLLIASHSMLSSKVIVLLI